MAIPSAVLYFISQHPYWSFPLILGLCNLPAVWLYQRSGSSRWLWWCFVGWLAAFANIFVGRLANTSFLEAFGSEGTAVIVGSEPAQASFNEQPIWNYTAVLRTADGRDLKIGFDTLTASLYPLGDRFLVPPQGERFVVRYIPGFERNIAIIAERSEFGKRQRLVEAQAALDQAAAQWALSPRNAQFVHEYREALRSFLQAHRGDIDPALAETLERRRAALDAAAQ
ncbi:hypothetical protein [Lysobacter antibioticus]|uniref:hypothetical protein n=1 Tax=Lysobacter antibioticus TaxID=84531 RepID=UPI0007166C30|nr:hypothetical protein [Lysobacter antibioticus]